MRRVIPITEQFQHFAEDLKGSFWGDCYGQARRFVHEAIERESLRLREVYLNCSRYERSAERRDQRNGFYYREFQTRFGCLRLKIARSRMHSFLPAVIGLFQRRAEDVTLLVREAFLRGVSTRQVGRVIASLQLGTLSAQTVSRLSRMLDSLVAAFHQSRIADEWAYLFLDGVSLRVRRPSGRKRVQMLVAYGVRRDGTRQLLAFLRSQGESQAAWQGLLEDLYRRGLTVTGGQGTNGSIITLNGVVVATNAPIGPNSITVTVTASDSSSQTSNPGGFTIDGPFYMTVYFDTLGKCSGCNTTVSRLTGYQVRNFSSSLAPSIWIGENETQSGWNCQQQNPGVSTTTCSAGFTVADIFTPVGCGFNFDDHWNWCQTGRSVGHLSGYDHTNAISINGVVDPPNSFASGTVINP